MVKKKRRKASRKELPRQKARLGRKRISVLSIVTLFFILLLTGTIYAPVRNAQFVYWDDDRNITDYPLVMGDLDASTTISIFSTPVIGNYNPLSNWTFALEKKIFVDAKEFPSDKERLQYFSRIVHLDNVLLHLLNIALLWLLLQTMGFSLTITALTAFLFALHPLHVESVAWATERKDVLFSLFFLSSIYTWYLARYRGKGRPYFILSSTLFAIGLFAKIQMVTLPLTLLLIDYYEGKRQGIQPILKKAHYFAMSLLFGVLGIYFLSEQGSLATNTTFAPLERLFIGAYSLTVYLLKSIYPYQLSALYPYPATLPLSHYLSLISFLGFFIALYYAFRRGHRTVVLGLGWFLVNVVFLLQFFGAGQGYIADRFTYIPYIGLFLLLGHFLSIAISRGMKWKVLLTLITTVWLGALVWITQHQVRVWDNTVTLFTQVINQFPRTMTPYRNRGNYYRDKGMAEEALRDYSRGLAIKADPEMYNSRGKLYFTSGQTDKAIADYKNAIKLSPKNGEYYINLGATYAKNKMFNQALNAINKGLQYSPGNANAYLNRSIIYMINGDYQHQIEDLKAYLAAHPNESDIWYEMGRAYFHLHRLPEAERAMTQALQYGDKGEYYQERAKVYYELGQLEQARSDAETAKKKGIALYPRLDELLNQ